MKSHKGMKFGQVLKLAKKTYKKRGGGEGDVESAPETGASTTAAPMGGRRRRTRRGRKSRRGGSDMY
jgi:hypothetical protein